MLHVAICLADAISIGKTCRGERFAREAIVASDRSTFDLVINRKWATIANAFDEGRSRPGDW